MPAIDFLIETETSESARAKQVSAMFDVPFSNKQKIEYKCVLPIEETDWNVGLIVGPSGCGKTTVMNRLFGTPEIIKWNSKSVIDDFDENLSIKEITDALSSVGFNTIPSWLKPYHVLSNGEKFRVELARLLLSGKEVICIDEFTSVVDRQVAKICSHAVQKYARKTGKRLVLSSCHYDIIEWLDPDWIYEPATNGFQRRLRRQSRPIINAEISRVKYETWEIFHKYHYMTADLNNAAKCFAVLIDGNPVCFAGVLYRPHASVSDIYGISRIVTLPDYQGIGLSMILLDKLGACYRALDKRLHTYPAHPPFIRTFMKSKNWKMVKKPGVYSPKTGGKIGFGGRPCAVFQYIGEAEAQETALQLIQP